MMQHQQQMMMMQQQQEQQMMMMMQQQQQEQQMMMGGMMGMPQGGPMNSMNPMNAMNNSSPDPPKSQDPIMEQCMSQVKQQVKKLEEQVEMEEDKLRKAASKEGEYVGLITTWRKDDTLGMVGFIACPDIAKVPKVTVPKALIPKQVFESSGVQVGDMVQFYMCLQDNHNRENQPTALKMRKIPSLTEAKKKLQRMQTPSYQTLEAKKLYEEFGRTGIMPQGIVEPQMPMQSAPQLGPQDPNMPLQQFQAGLNPAQSGGMPKAKAKQQAGKVIPKIQEQKYGEAPDLD